MEKMTFALFAMVHGDSEAISENETFEAETKEELVLQLANSLRIMASQMDREING